MGLTCDVTARPSGTCDGGAWLAAAAVAGCQLSRDLYKTHSMVRCWLLAAAMSVATGRAATAPAAAAATVTTQEVWVDCTLGDDSNVGTSAAPFKSLVKARDALRGARSTSPDLAAVPAAVNIVGRICRSYDQVGHGQPQNTSLTLDGRDSHTTWRTTTSGSHSAEAVLSGGLAINASELRAVSGAEAAWFKPNAVRQIRKLSLERVEDAGRLVRPLPAVRIAHIHALSQRRWCSGPLFAAHFARALQNLSGPGVPVAEACALTRTRRSY